MIYLRIKISTNRAHCIFSPPRTNTVFNESSDLLNIEFSIYSFYIYCRHVLYFTAQFCDYTVYKYVYIQIYSTVVNGTRERKSFYNIKTNNKEIFSRIEEFVLTLLRMPLKTVHNKILFSLQQASPLL